MKVFSVGDFKTHFSDILDLVRLGEEVAITFGRKKEIVARLVPHSPAPNEERPLGLLAGKASVQFADDFKMTEEAFLGL